MSWQQLSPHEQRALDKTRQETPEIVPLAQVLALASRIEPLLLRNARVRFANAADTGLESLLWFSPLVRVRATEGLRLHDGIARTLATELRERDPERFAAAWRFVGEHSAHWPAAERVLQALRHCALVGDADEQRRLQQELLRCIHRAGDDVTRVHLARHSRESLAFLPPGLPADDEARWLGQYAATVLGGSSGPDKDGAPAGLPPPLAASLPSPYKPVRLGIEVRHDPALRQLVLHCVEAAAGVPAIDLPTPLPAELHIASEGAASSRHTVSVGTRVALERPARRLQLATVDGQRYTLTIELPATGADGPEAAPRIVWLSHVPEDRELAERVVRWLAGFGIAASRREEGPAQPAPDDTQGPAVPLLRLWTRQAGAAGFARPDAGFAARGRSLILRSADAEAPMAGQGSSELITLPNLDDAQAHESVQAAEQLRAWLERDGDGAPANEDLPAQGPDRVADLLAELTASAAPRGPNAETATSTESVSRIAPAVASAAPVLEMAALTLDRKLVPEPGLYRCLAGGGRAQARIEDGELSPEEPILLLLPGLAANAEGSFADLWPAAGHSDFLPRMEARFGRNIVAFEHWSLSRHPIANALDLAHALPPRARLTMIGHSTGGLLAELLCRSQVAGGGPPFDDEEIALFATAPHTRRVLAELSAALAHRQFVVERFIAVGTPFRGTLLFQKVEPLLKLLPALIKVASLGSSILASTAVETLLRAMRKPSELVGIEAIQPESAFIRLINNPAVTVDADLSAITGDTEASGLLARLGQLAADRAFGGDNDLMVPTASMVGGARRSSGGRVAFFRGADVNHFSYFRHRGVVDAITDAIREPHPIRPWQAIDRPSTKAR